MSSESENDLDREVDASMRMFQKSKVGPAAAITPVVPARIMLVLDGSSQDQTSINAAQYLRDRFDVETLVLDARDRPDDIDPEDQIDLAVERTNSVTGSRPIKRKEGDSYDAILAALSEHAVDLVIVPCPFARSFEQVGADSAGTVIDVLLSRCDRPLLVVRRDDQQLAQCVDRVSMVVGGECDMETRAAAWVFGMASEKANVSLDLVIEKEQYENIKSIIEAVAPESTFDADQFREALTKTHQSIHDSMSKTASTIGVSYRMRPQAGESAPPNLMTESTNMLLVMPLEVDDRFGQGFVQDRIRRSPHPVLVIPGHVTN